MPVVLRGPARSTLLPAARLALEEKGVAHALREANLRAVQILLGHSRS